jgi:flagellin-specific chaperone FliS
LFRPALDQVQRAVGALNVEKWKKGNVRDEAGDHISAILRDLHTTLPPLLDTADASPGTISKILPVSRNLSALYDVLLSVVEAARISGSAEELAPLEQALTRLGDARAALDDRLQASAAALEKQEIDLRSTLQAREAVKCAVTSPPATSACPAPASVRKAKRIPKPPATPPQPSTSPANLTPKTQN